MFTYLMFIAIFLCFLHFWFKYGTENVRLIRKLPCPEETFLIGNLAMIIWLPPVQIFKLGRRMANKYKDIYGWWAFFLTGVNILNPEDIEIVTAGSKHSEKGKVYSIVEPWLKEGLLLSKGQKWQQRRKILTSAFHFNILKRYYVVLEENGQRLLDALDKIRGEPIDIIPVISEYTLSSICETAMGTALHEASTGQQYKNSIYKLGNLFVQRFARLHLIPNITFKMSSLGRNTYKELAIVQGFTKKVIAERREFIKNNNVDLTDDNGNDDDEVYLTSKKKNTAMLDLLLLGQKEGVIDEAGVQEEVDTFMFEGHDTTAAGLTYCLMLLANHKEIQDKIVAELKEIYGDSNREAKIEDQNQMKYLECCIKESLRLYPPVPFISRTITETAYLSGYKIPEGIGCHIHIYDLHRREDLFKNATVFDPDRFLPENSIGRHPYAYIPFSAGPRNCIGQRFAMMEMKSCVAAILRKFELQPVTTPEDIEFMADVVLRNTKPVYVKFVERNN